MAKAAAASFIRDTVPSSAIDTVSATAIDATANARGETWRSFLVQWGLVYDYVKLEDVLDLLFCSTDSTPSLLTHSSRGWSVMRPMMTQKGLEPWFQQEMGQSFRRLFQAAAFFPNRAWASLVTVINAAYYYYRRRLPIDSSSAARS